MSLIRVSDRELRDLAADRPALVDAITGARTGFTIERLLGVGGMASVFLARRTELGMPVCLSPITPDRIALKVLHVARAEIDPFDFFAKENEAYRRLSSLRPPSPFCVQAFGAGAIAIEDDAGKRRAPWLAIELVEGGADGVRLDDRIDRAKEGVDPPRALRWVRGLFEGLRVLHAHGVIHRDLKPENVLLSGPIDAEVAKIADYGIARVGAGKTGLGSGTIPYAGKEQMFATPGESNPFVGAWTDVHALAQVIAAIVGGGAWLTHDEWQSGERRSLRDGRKIHRGFLADAARFEHLDRAIARGASPRLPPIAFERAGARLASVRAILERAPPGAAPRFPDLASFADAILPALESIASAWIEAENRARRPATAFRSTSTGPASSQPSVRESPGRSPVTLERALVRADGSVIACAAGSLYFLAGADVTEIPLEAAARAIAKNTRALVDAGHLGDAFIAPHAVVFVRAGVVTIAALPDAIEEARAAYFADGALHVVAIAREDADEGAIVLSTSDATTWAAPIVVPLNGGVASAAAHGPNGALLVGERNGRARATLLHLDGRAQSFGRGLGAVAPLVGATCATEASWAASDGAVVRFDRAGAALEETPAFERAVALAVDHGANPWLVAPRAIFRRDADGSRITWREIVRRAPDAPAFVAIGFSPEEARIVDERGGVVSIVGDVADRNSVS